MIDSEEREFANQLMVVKHGTISYIKNRLQAQLISMDPNNQILFMPQCGNLRDLGLNQEEKQCLFNRLMAGNSNKIQ